jgi:hypothetical protein
MQFESMHHLKGIKIPYDNVSLCKYKLSKLLIQIQIFRVGNMRIVTGNEESWLALFMLLTWKPMCVF